MYCVSCKALKISPLAPPFGGFLCSGGHIHCSTCADINPGFCPVCNTEVKFVELKYSADLITTEPTPDIDFPYIPHVTKPPPNNVPKPDHIVRSISGYNVHKKSNLSLNKEKQREAQLKLKKEARESVRHLAMRGRKPLAVTPASSVVTVCHKDDFMKIHRARMAARRENELKGLQYMKERCEKQGISLNFETKTSPTEPIVATQYSSLDEHGQKLLNKINNSASTRQLLRKASYLNRALEASNKKLDVNDFINPNRAELRNECGTMTEKVINNIESNKNIICLQKPRDFNENVTSIETNVDKASYMVNLMSSQTSYKKSEDSENRIRIEGGTEERNNSSGINLEAKNKRNYFKETSRSSMVNVTTVVSVDNTELPSTSKSCVPLMCDKETQVNVALLKKYKESIITRPTPKKIIKKPKKTKGKLKRKTSGKSRNIGGIEPESTATESKTSLRTITSSVDSLKPQHGATNIEKPFNSKDDNNLNASEPITSADVYPTVCNKKIQVNMPKIIKKKRKNVQKHSTSNKDRVTKTKTTKDDKSSTKMKEKKKITTTRPIKSRVRGGSVASRSKSAEPVETTNARPKNNSDELRKSTPKSILRNKPKPKTSTKGLESKSKKVLKKTKDKKSEKSKYKEKKKPNAVRPIKKRARGGSVEPKGTSTARIKVTPKSSIRDSSSSRKVVGKDSVSKSKVSSHKDKVIENLKSTEPINSKEETISVTDDESETSSERDTSDVSECTSASSLPDDVPTTSQHKKSIKRVKFSIAEKSKVKPKLKAKLSTVNIELRDVKKRVKSNSEESKPKEKLLNKIKKTFKSKTVKVKSDTSLEPIDSKPSTSKGRTEYISQENKTSKSGIPKKRVFGSNKNATTKPLRPIMIPVQQPSKKLQVISKPKPYNPFKPYDSDE